MSNNSPKAVILMGVAGSGKTAVGKGVVTRLNWLFLDAAHAESVRESWEAKKRNHH
jgi:shikimate kinase